MATETIISFNTIDDLRENILPSDYPHERDLSRKDAPLVVASMCSKFFINIDEITRYKNVLSFFPPDQRQDLLLLVTEDEKTETVINLFSLQEQQALRIGTDLKGCYSEPYMYALNYMKRHTLNITRRGDFTNNFMQLQNGIHRIKLSDQAAQDLSW